MKTKKPQLLQVKAFVVPTKGREDLNPSPILLGMTGKYYPAEWFKILEIPFIWDPIKVLQLDFLYNLYQKIHHLSFEYNKHRKPCDTIELKTKKP